MTYQDDEFILVGNFGRPIGLKGSLKLNSFTRPADNIKKYSSFFFKKEDSFISLDLEKITKSGKNLIIFIKDCGSLETAESIYKGKEIYILRSDIPRQKNKFFWNNNIQRITLLFTEFTLVKLRLLSVKQFIRVFIIFSVGYNLYKCRA